MPLFRRTFAALQLGQFSPLYCPQSFMEISNSNRHTWLINGTLTALFLVILAMVAWGLNKGFDLSDEGLHTHLLAYPTEAGKRGGYQWFFSWMHLGILQAKALRMVLMLASTGVFTWGMMAWMRTNDYFEQRTTLYNWLTVLAFIGIGTFVNYSQQPRTLSYNTLTLVLMQAIAGLFLYANALYQQRRSVWQLLAVTLAMLPLLYGLYEAKFTSAISMVLLLVFVQVGWLLSERPSWRSLLVFIALGVASLVFLIMLYCVLKRTSPFELYNHVYYELWEHYSQFKQGVSKGRVRHNVLYLLISYYNTAWRAIGDAIVKNYTVVLLSGIVFVVFRWIKQKSSFPANNYAYYVTPVLLALVLLLFGSTVVSHKWHYNGDAYNKNAFDLYLLTFACLLASVAALLTMQQLRYLFSSHSCRQVVLVCFMLFMIPIGGAAGTNNPLPLQCTQQVYAWFGIFFILTYHIAKHTQFGLPQRWWLWIISAFAFSQIYNGYLYYAFRINGSLFDQKYALKNMPRAEGMLFDAHTRTMLQRANTLIQQKTNFAEGDPIVSLTYSPGMVYLLGGISPYSPYYRNEPNYSDRNCFNIMRATLPNIENTLVMDYSDRRIKPELINCFLAQGIDLAGNYVLIGTVPYYTGKKGKKLAIYAPTHLLKDASSAKNNDPADTATQTNLPADTTTQSTLDDKANDTEPDDTNADESEDDSDEVN